MPAGSAGSWMRQSEPAARALLRRTGLYGLLRSRPRSLEVILTGRNPSQALLDEADYVTEMVMVRHLMKKGSKQEKGLNIRAKISCKFFPSSGTL